MAKTCTNIGEGCQRMYCNICTGEEGKTVLVRAAKTFKQAGESGQNI